MDKNAIIYNNKPYYDSLNLGNSRSSLLKDDAQITFVNYARNYCVCFVDIVDSTRATSEISDSFQFRQYYAVFLNIMASIIKIHNGRTIKNHGDCLLYYFPRTFDANNEAAFEDAIDCGLAMIMENERLNEYYALNDLPPISYRISANYGKVELAISLNSNNADLFGSSVNQCSKINQMASPNQMIIHSDLHDVIRKMTFYGQYTFNEMEKNQNEKGNDNSLVYSVSRVISQDFKHNEIPEGQQQKRTLSSRGKEDQSSSLFNILLIDDDKDILFTFEAVIKNEGYKVNSFSNPIEALDHYSSIDPNLYDLIIMDIRMPELNGIKLYSKIKILNPDVKVLFLSALNALDEVLSLFPEINSSEIIRKPVEPRILLSKVEAKLRS